MEKPLLTISIPTYNRAHYLKETLTSIKIQFDENSNLQDLVEITISDNCSTDNTKEVAESYRPFFKHFIYTVNEKNLGFDLNILNVVKKSTGTYCWYMADDDVMVNGSIDYVIKKLQTNNYDIITVESRPVDPQSDYRVRQNFNDSDIFETNDPEAFFYGNDSLGAVSNLILNKDLWMNCLDENDYLKYWLYYEVPLKMFIKTKKKMLNVLQKLVYTGQDCRWAENGTELTTFINSNLLLERMIGFGFNKEKIMEALEKNRKLLPIVLLRAKGHGLVCDMKTLTFMRTTMKKVGFLHLTLATLLYFIPNKLVVVIRDIRHLIFG